MNIEITYVSYESNVPRVAFATSVGSAEGVWRGSGFPIVGKTYHVEFTVNVVADASVNATRVQGESASLRATEGIVTMCAMFESQDPDGMGFFRLAKDSLTMIDVAGDLPVGEFIAVTIPSSDLDIYPIGY